MDRDSSCQKLKAALRRELHVLPYDHRSIRGPEADPPLVLVSPFFSVARGVAASSLVTRALA
jgi:hypothetical protein